MTIWMIFVGMTLQIRTRVEPSCIRKLAKDPQWVDNDCVSGIIFIVINKE